MTLTRHYVQSKDNLNLPFCLHIECRKIWI